MSTPNTERPLRILRPARALRYELMGDSRVCSNAINDELFELQRRSRARSDVNGRRKQIGAPMPTAKNKPTSRLLGKRIKAQFCDGKWHPFEMIVTRSGAPAKNVWSTLDHMWRHGTYKTKCERKKVGTEYHFRLSPEEKQISVHELIEKLTPILKELEIQGRANAATMSPPTVRIMTAKIQKLLEEWAE
jgi:hypothetical protein